MMKTLVAVATIFINASIEPAEEPAKVRYHYHLVFINLIVINYISSLPLALIEVGDECAIDLDCRFDERAVCDKSKGCQLKSRITRIERSVNNVTLHRKTIVNACNSTADCAFLGSSSCGPMGTCVCNRAHFLSANVDKCIPGW